MFYCFYPWGTKSIAHLWMHLDGVEFRKESLSHEWVPNFFKGCMKLQFGWSVLSVFLLNWRCYQIKGSHFGLLLCNKMQDMEGLLVEIESCCGLGGIWERRSIVGMMHTSIDSNLRKIIALWRDLYWGKTHLNLWELQIH